MYDMFLARYLEKSVAVLVGKKRLNHFLSPEISLEKSRKSSLKNPYFHAATLIRELAVILL